jgi:predicted site-specific integrase-resolvase
MDGKYFSKWLKDIGVSRMTGYRWTESGKVKVKTIYGRKYIEQSEIDRFFREGALAPKQMVPSVD